MSILLIILLLLVVITLLLGYYVAFTLSGVSILVALVGYFFGMFDINLLYALPQRIFYIMNSQVLMSIPLFIFMGVVLDKSGVSTELIRLIGQLLSSRQGGMFYAVIIVGALLGASIGVAGASVVALGTFAIPALLNAGYNKPMSSGVIIASGTMSQIIPPSIVLIILSEQISQAYQIAQLEQGIFAPDTISTNEMFAGALLPSMLLTSLYILYTCIYVKFTKQPHSRIKTPPLAIDTSRIFSVIIVPTILILSVLGSILFGIATATESASIGAVGALLIAAYHSKKSYWILASLPAMLILIALGFIDNNIDNNIKHAVFITLAILITVIICIAIAIAFKILMGKSILRQILSSSITISSSIFAIIIGALVFSLVFRGLDGDVVVQNFLTSLPFGEYGIIIIVMLSIFILGFFLDFLEIILIVIPITAPIILQFDNISPIWLGVMIALNIQTSFLTPPFGFSLFYFRSIAPNVIKTVDINKGIIPFVLMILLAMVILWVFPSIATYLPSVIY